MNKAGSLTVMDRVREEPGRRPFSSRHISEQFNFSPFFCSAGDQTPGAQEHQASDIPLNYISSPDAIIFKPLALL